jgi:hypothetical protein
LGGDHPQDQGKSFDKVIIDIGRGAFAHGQVYVALSRCTSFEGLVLKKPILKKHIWMDWQVVKFLTRYQYKKAEEALPVEEKVKLIEEAILKEAPLEMSISTQRREDQRGSSGPKRWRNGV